MVREQSISNKEMNCAICGGIFILNPLVATALSESSSIGNSAVVPLTFTNLLHSKSQTCHNVDNKTELFGGTHHPHVDTTPCINDLTETKMGHIPLPAIADDS